MPNRLDEMGVSFVLDYEKKEGRSPTDVSKKRKFVGFDIMSVSPKEEDHRTIEVKTTKGIGIPDAFGNEFTRELRFVATHLYVVCIAKEGETVNSLHIIPKKEIDKYNKNHKISQHIRFASQLTTRLKNGDFNQPI